MKNLAELAQREKGKSRHKKALIVIIVIFAIIVIFNLAIYITINSHNESIDPIPDNEYTNTFVRHDEYQYLLGPGTYTIGEDLPDGLYDITAVKGAGHIYEDNYGSDYFFSELVASKDSKKSGFGSYNDYYTTVSNRLFENGYKLRIEGVEVIAKTSFSTLKENAKREINTNETYSYENPEDMLNGGQDIISGTYDIYYEGEYINIEIVYPEAMKSTLYFYYSNDSSSFDIYRNVDIYDGVKVKINGEGKVTLKPSGIDSLLIEE